MSEMIDRVAKAIFEVWARRKGSIATWDELVALNADGAPASSEIYDLAMEEARAAIEAMREPTPRMVHALWKHRDAAKIQSENRMARIGYDAMIDAALCVSDEHPTGEDRNGLSAEHASAARRETPSLTSPLALEGRGEK